MRKKREASRRTRPATAEVSDANEIQLPRESVDKVYECYVQGGAEEAMVLEAEILAHGIELETSSGSLGKGASGKVLRQPAVGSDGEVSDGDGLGPVVGGPGSSGCRWRLLEGREPQSGAAVDPGAPRAPGRVWRPTRGGNGSGRPVWWGSSAACCDDNGLRSRGTILKIWG